MMTYNHLVSNSNEPAKAKSKKQIANEMGIHPNTLARYLKQADLVVPRGFISPKQLQMIYDRLGWYEKV